MTISRDDVIRIAELAKLHFSEPELDEFTGQFQRILGYVEKLRELNVEGVEPTSHVPLAGDFEACPFREDETQPSLSVAEALQNAPDRGEGHFRVPRVI